MKRARRLQCEGVYREDEDREDEDTPHKLFCKMYHNFIFFTFQAISFIHTSKICTVLTFSKMYETKKLIEYFLFYAQKPGVRTFEIDYTNRSFGRLTLPGEPLEKKRYRRGEDGLPAVIFKETKRPHLVQEYFDGAAAIDVHYHFRQGSLALEKVWDTQCWWHQVFATLLGKMETNALLALIKWKPQAVDTSHRTFLSELALQLINNPFGGIKEYRLQRSCESSEQPTTMPREDFA